MIDLTGKSNFTIWTEEIKYEPIYVRSGLETDPTIS